MNYIIRKSRREDCYGIAHVTSVSWKETYKGIVPDWFLEKLQNNEKKRAKKIYDDFDVHKNHQFVLEIDNQIVGFVAFGLTTDTTFKNCGEIYTLYIIKQYMGYGFGRELVENVIKELKQMGIDKMIVACLKGNPSNEFYKHIGGKYIKDGAFKNLNLPENIYYYENI